METFIKRALIVWICILAILYATLSVVRHNHYQSTATDLGIYDQAVWQYSKFLWPYNTVKERFILGDHLTLTLPVLAPFFWIWNDARALLVFQAVWVSFSVLAVYRLVRLRKFSPLVALCLSCVYSLFYGIQYGIFFDFHPVLLAVGLIPWMLYFLEAKKTKLFILSLILLLFTQENMGLVLASLGFIYFFKKPYRKLSIAFVLGGIVVTLVSMNIVAYFSPVGYQYTPHLSTQLSQFIRQLYDAPDKRLVWLYSLSAFSFLPLLSPGAMLAVIADLAQYFTTGSEFMRMWSPFLHHRAILAPYLLLGTLDVFEFLAKRKINVTGIALLLVVSCLVQQFIFHYPLNKLSKPEYWRVDSWITDNNKMISTIPPTIRLATQQSLVPHLSHRKDIYLVWPRVHDAGWWLDFNQNADYLLIDTHPGEWLTMLLETPEHVNEALFNMEKAKKITLVRKINDIRLYRINH
jgi:uncharacterized membrane protein